MNESRPNLVDLPVLAHRVAQLVLVDFVRLGFPLGRERALGEHQNEVVGPVGRRAMHRLQITVAALDRQRMEQRAVHHRVEPAVVATERGDIGLHKTGRVQAALLCGPISGSDGCRREVDADHGIAIGGQGQ
jgi:hypothetical protein